MPSKQFEDAPAQDPHPERDLAIPHEAHTSSEEEPHYLKKIALVIFHQWLLIGIGISCALAYYFPEVAMSGGIIRAEYTILYGAVALIFLISGLGIPPDKLKRHIMHWRLHLLVQGISFLVVPAIMVAIVHVIIAADTQKSIDRVVLAGYILLACLPTTIASNVAMTRAAGGDDAAAVVEVVIANLLGPFVTPGWAMSLLPQTEDFEELGGPDMDLLSMYGHVFERLGLSVLLPLVVGLAIRWVFPDKVAWAYTKFRVAKVATACLPLISWTTFSTCFATDAIENLSAACIVFILFFNIAMYLLLTAICFIAAHPPFKTGKSRIRSFIWDRIQPEEVIAICFCGPAKAIGLGIPLISAMWSFIEMTQQAKLSIPVVLYTTEQIVVAHFFVFLFKRWLSKQKGTTAENSV